MVEPPRMPVLANEIHCRIGVFAVAVGVELGEQGGHRGGEDPAVILGRGRRGLIGIDHRPLAAQPIAAFHRAEFVVDIAVRGEVDLVRGQRMNPSIRFG